MFFITNIAFSQYKGGSGDGSVLFTSPLTYLDEFFKNGSFLWRRWRWFFHWARLFYLSDGVHSLHAHYLGGNGDGFNIFRAKDYYVDGKPRLATVIVEVTEGRKPCTRTPGFLRDPFWATPIREELATDLTTTRSVSVFWMEQWGVIYRPVVEKTR
ncbi:MAG: hypothetical protein R3B93_24560 [Bacteroidia bacterium]